MQVANNKPVDDLSQIPVTEEYVPDNCTDEDRGKDAELIDYEGKSIIREPKQLCQCSQDRQTSLADMQA